MTGNVQTDYYYDESGNVFGFKRGDSEYYYIRNGQGDIIGILDSSGIQIVSYVYDSWGKLVSISGSQAETIGEANPFRYRGYYYDTETGLYYLQSRYYDPEVGRFLNADLQLNDDTLGNNLFAYCGNNPISRTDAEGEGWWILAGAIIGGLVSGVTKAVSNVTPGKKWNDGIIGAVAGGAVAGAIVAATGGTAGGIAAAFAGAATESLTNEVASYVPRVSSWNGQSTTKKVTKENVVNSAKTAVIETAANGMTSAITGIAAGKLLPINNGWFKPQKFVSSFFGKYAVRSDLQAITQATMDFGVNGLEYSMKQRYNRGQSPTVTFFPEAQLRTAG